MHYKFSAFGCQIRQITIKRQITMIWHRISHIRFMLFFCGVTRLRGKTEEELPINQNQLNSDTHKDESAEEKDVFSKTSNLLDS